MRPAGQPVIDFHFMGCVPLDDSTALQRRLVYEAGGEVGRRVTVLLCEHPPQITIGRAGSRQHIRWTDEQLRRKRLTVQWVNRGGGCILHGPGQLAIYPMVPLKRMPWTVGELLRRLHAGIASTLQELKVDCRSHETSFSLCGRTGVLAAFGLAVQNDISCHGVFLNVNPRMTNHALIDCVPPQRGRQEFKASMSCLLAERRQAVKMTTVRSLVVQHLAAAFATERYHLHTGHPHRLPQTTAERELTANLY